MVGPCYELDELATAGWGESTLLKFVPWDGFVDEGWVSDEATMQLKA